MRNRRTSPRPLVGAAVALAAAGAGEFATVEVRGTVGARAAIDTSHEGTDDVGLIEWRATTLSWGERPALAMAVRGDADIETLVAVADSLVEVSRDDFEAYALPNRITASSTSLP